MQRPDFFVFTGCDAYFDKVMSAGAMGVVSGISSVVPEIVVEEFRAAMRKDRRGVREAQKKIDLVLGTLGKTWARTLKYAGPAACSKRVHFHINHTQSEYKNRIQKDGYYRYPE